MLPQIIKQSLNDTKPTLENELKVISIQFKDLVEAGNNSLATGIVLGISLNGAMLIENIDNLGGLIPDDLLKPINDLAYQVAYSISHDDNYSQDLNTTITVTREKPWDEKDESIDQPQANPEQKKKKKQSIYYYTI